MFLDLSVEIRLILSIATSFLLAILLKYPIFNVAVKKENFEKENSRSSHNGIIPNIGGAIIYVSFLASSLLYIKVTEANLQYVLLSFTVLFFLGLYDDIIVISHQNKFLGQIIGVLVLILGNVYFTSFQGLFGLSLLPYYVAIPFTFIAVIGIINAMNLIDGIDGLCSGMSALIVFAFSFWFLKNGYYAFAILGFIIIAAIIPFFVLNVFGKKYKMFLGDNGSLFLGMVLSVFIIKFCESNIGHNTWLHFSNAPAVAFTLMAIPVLDTIRVFITRFINKKSPYRPDRTHLHHLFLDLFNKNHKKATFCILSIQLFYLILVFFGHNLSGEILIVISISSYLILYLSVYTLKVRKEKTKKAIETN